MGWAGFTRHIYSTHTTSPVNPSFDGGGGGGCRLMSRRSPHQTPAHKQIKLQFHHLEGAVSCPNAVFSPLSFSTLHIYTHAHKTLHLCLNRAPPPPKCQPLSTAQLPRGMEGFEGRKRGMGGCGGKGDWEYARGSYCSFIPVKYFATVKVQGERVRRKGYTAMASR